jgi:intracellular sulfur oxidation DsrE/DsrF family protein
VASGAGKVTLALIVHGPALKAFHGAQARPDVVHGMSEFVKAGLTPIACANTMRAQGVDVKDLLPGFAVADRGGVVRLAELQAQGYAYLRP